MATKGIFVRMLIATVCVCSASVALAAKTFSILLGPETPVLDLGQREALGFVAGPPDGYLGVHLDAEGYTFFVPGARTCSGQTLQGTYRLGGNLGQITDDFPCAVSLKDGAQGNVEPNGYSFDRDYSGGGPVASILIAGAPAILMVYHGEWHPGGNCNSVPWFYGSLGMAVSTDGGATFRSLGEIIQPYPTRTQGLGTASACQNAHVGYGTLVSADASGNYLPRSWQSNRNDEYFYVFYTDSDPTLATAPCDNGNYCIAVARARRKDVVEAIESGSTAAFPALFKKYYCGSEGCGFSEPGTGQDPDNAVNSGHYTPLFPTPAGQPSVIYDSTIRQYLMAYESALQLYIQASPNLLEWSGIPLANGTLDESPNLLGYPTLVGEGDRPKVGGSRPFLFYLNTLTSFPNWKSPDAVYVSRQIQITVTGR